MITPRKNEITEIRPRGNRRVMVDCGGPTKTEQQHKDRLNITTIMAKARAQGMMPQMERIQSAKYGDFTNQTDFQELHDRVIRAKDEFAQLPSDVRNRFHNDPGELIEFINNPDNLEESYDLGLRKRPIEKPAEPTVEPVEPATTE